MSTDKPVDWTEQQRQAIDARGGNVLVTASAGTGKTAVLSGRCVSIVSDEVLRPDVLNMLVLTFTEAAAEQMHARIAQQLREAYHRTRNTHLLQQLIQLQGANISTIHSFCKRLITEHFHTLSLDPAFRVIDADETMLLKGETLNETIEWAWQQEHLVDGLHTLLDRRDLRGSGGFLNGVIRLSDFLEGVISPDVWCDQARRLAEQAEPLTSDLGRKQQQWIGGQLRIILTQLKLAKTLYEDEVSDGDWGVKLEERLIEPVAACLQCLDATDWSGCAERVRGFARPRLSSPKGLPDGPAKVLGELQKTAVAAFTKLNDLAVLNPDYLDVVGRSASLQTHVLVDLVQRFNHLYAERKRSLNGLDFADLERYALRLLTHDGPTGEGLQPSETGLALRGRYEYIFVDEYQDINPVQQAILDAVSSGDNVFVVGDVKQSIYAWRGAEPTIFLERLAPATTDPSDPSPGFRVDLNYNFRSAKGILDFVNQIFGRIMTRDIANIDYDQAARLQPAPDVDTTPADRPIVEMHILDEKGVRRTMREDDNSDESEELAVVQGRQRQAALIARRIREIVGAETGRAEFQVQDKDSGALRDVAYRDIVILMRSLAKKANDYVEILRLAGVPVSCDATAGYFEATEVCDMLSLLKVLDNPQRDIELAAVLRSPLFNFTDTELAKIRLYGQSKVKRASFHACTTWYREGGPDKELRAKLHSTFARLDEWRRFARRGHLATLLWRIYRQSGYLAFVSALPNGQARKANLLRLHDRAVQFEGFASNSGIASLTRFVDFLERLQEAGQDWAPAQPGSAAGNAVRILSVHKSKGLEFPVVFLAELESEFNRRDMHADIVADADDAVGLQVIDGRRNTKLRSLAHEVIGEKKLAVALAEEMRVLYVATTRARDRLILTAAPKRTDCAKVLANGVLAAGETVPAWLLKPCRNALEWVLYGLADQRSLHKAFDTGLVERVTGDGLFDFHLHEGDALRELSQYVVTLRTSRGKAAFFEREGSADPSQGRQLLAQVRDNLNRDYPFSHAVHLAAKSSVTKLTHDDDVFAPRDHSEALDRQPAAVVASGPVKSDPRLARAVGTAAHLVISTLDLKKPVSRKVIEMTRDRLVREGAFPDGVAEVIDVDGILSFFESELGEVVCQARNEVWQEWPFTYGLPAREADDAAARASGTADEIIVVQGVIDLLVRTPEGLLVIDFKTDRVGGDEIARRVDVYRGQLELYAKAAAAICREKVLEKWLYFLAARQPVRI